MNLVSTNNYLNINSQYVLMSFYGNIDDFKMGFRNEALNIIALNSGRQIMVCRKEKKTNNKVFLSAKKSFSSEFTISEYGKKLMHEYIKNNGHIIKEREETNYIAELFYINDIPGTDLRFWQELYTQKEFCLWDPKNGPYKYYTEKRKLDSINMREKSVLWILRVYKMPFTLKLHKDYKEFQNNAILHNEQLRTKLLKDFIRVNSPPSSRIVEFRKRCENISDIVKKYRKIS